MLEDIRRLSAIFERALPPYALEGPVGVYYTQQVEFTLFAHFGQLDAFNRRHFSKDESAKKPFTDILKELKKTKPSDETIAAGMLMTYILGRRAPVAPETAARIKHYFGEIIKELPSMEVTVANYFSEQHALANYGASSHRVHRPDYYSHLPDRSLSTHMLSQHSNPRTSLVAAMLDGLTFGDDGVFFEGANFRAADMRRTAWHPSSSIKGALLEGADLSGATGLTNEMMAECYIDARTKLPAYLDRAKIAKMHAALDLPAAPPFTELEQKYMPKSRKSRSPEPGGMA